MHIVWKSGAQHRTHQLIDRRDLQAAFIQESALPTHHAETFILHRIVNHPQHDLTVPGIRNRNREDRHAVGVIERPIQRIHQPLTGRTTSIVRPTLFARDAIARVHIADLGDQVILGLFIHLGHQVDHTLHLDIVLFAKAILQDLASALCQAN